MRSRPKWFMILSAVLVMVAASFPLQIMMIYDHGIDEMSAVLEKLTLLNWMVIAGALVAASCIWQASPWTRIAVPGLIAVVAINNLFVGYYATDYSMWTATCATFGFMLVNTPLLHPKLQWIFGHPERRWWIRAERKRISVPVLIEGTRLESAKAETFDLSESGAFVPLVREVGVGDWITLRMKFGIQQIRCQARVVRRSDSAGIYPAGVGLQFMNMTWRQRRELRRHLGRGA